MNEKKITYTSLSTDENGHHAYEQALQKVEGGLGKRYPMVIDGKKVFADTEFRVISPIDTSMVIGCFQQGDARHGAMAISSAKTAFSSWGLIEWTRRAGIIRKTADILKERLYRVAAIVTCEVGKTREEAIAEVSEAIDMLHYHQEVYEKNQGYILPMRPEGRGTTHSVMHPYGVWAVISPFNFPVSLAAGMAGGALLTGNTVVLKPTSKAPLSGYCLYRAFIEGGVPSGAIQYLTGPGEPFGNLVVKHTDIAGIAFTGSRDAGMWLYRNFSHEQPYPKPLIAEMGSKNPVIVTSHANLEKAVEGIVHSAFGYNGQKCSATSRVYIHSSVKSAFLKALLQRVSDLIIGDPRKREVFMGPLIDEYALKTFEGAVEICRKDGGAILYGGKALTDREYSNGTYVEPTVVTGLSDDHPLMKRELFVPFLIVKTFHSLQNALEMANGTPYGLTAGIFTENEEEREYFFKHIQSGVCYANREGGATTGAWPGSQSFGGWNASGSTGKGVGGPYYLLSYLREQAQTRL